MLNIIKRKCMKSDMKEVNDLHERNPRRDGVISKLNGCTQSSATHEPSLFVTVLLLWPSAEAREIKDTAETKKGK